MSDIVKALRGDREAIAKGSLTLDEEKARQKLRDFRLPDPHYYVLQLVRAASALGAREFHLSVSPNGVECFFDAEIPAELLDDMWSRAFADRTTPEETAIHYLALGLGSADALRPKFVSISSGSVYREVEYAEDELRFAEGDRSIDFPGSTRIELKEYFRFGHIREYFLSRGKLPEAVIVRDFCRGAEMSIYVEEELVRDTRGDSHYVASDEVEGASATVGIDPVAMDGVVALVKHGVRVQFYKIPYHGMAGRGFYRSPEIATDLSGTRVVENVALARSLQLVAWSAYHRALKQWLESRELGFDAPRLAVMRSLFEKLPQRMHESAVSGAGTVELVEWLFDQPVFISAVGEKREVSLRQLISDDRGLAYATSTFRDLSGDREVLPVYAGQEIERSALRAAARYLDVPTLDATANLERERVRQENIARWEVRSEREPLDFSIMRTFRIDEREASVFIPLNEVGVLRSSELGLKIYRDRKLMHQRELRLTSLADLGARSIRIPIGIVVDGPFLANPEFSDIVPDATYGKLAAKVLQAVPELMEELAGWIVERDGRVHQKLIEAVDTFISVLLDQTFPVDLLREMGFDTTISEVIQASNVFGMERPGDAKAFTHVTMKPVSMFGLGLQLEMDDEVSIDILGRLVDVPSFTVYRSMSEGGGARRASLRDILDGDWHMVLERNGDWRDLLDSAQQQLPEHDPIVVVNAAQKAILDRLAPNFSDASVLLKVNLAEAQYMQRELFDRPEKPGRLKTIERTVGESSIRVDLEGHVHPGCNVYFIYKDRLLERVSLDLTMGRYSAYVRSEEIAPEFDWSGVVRSSVYESLLEEVQHTCALALHAWWRDALEGEFPKGPGLRALHLRVVAARIGQGRDLEVPAIPVLTMQDGEWSQSFCSYVELDEARKRAGDIVAYVIGDRADQQLLPFEGAPVVAPGSQTGCEALERLFPETRFVDATLSRLAGDNTQEFRRYMRRSVVAFHLNGSGVQHTTMSDGIYVKILFLPDATYGTGKSRVQTTVLYQGRALESIDIEVPLGRFRAVVYGTPIGPDPSYGFVARGRAETLSAVYRAAARAIEIACERQNKLRSGQADYMAEAVREDMIRMIDKAKEVSLPYWDHLYDLLRKTQLFRTNRGRMLSLEGLAEIARGGVVPYALKSGPVEALKIHDRDLPWYRSILAPAWRLKSVDAMEVIELAATGPRQERASGVVAEVGGTDRHPLVEAIIEQIERARELRVDLLGDEVLQSLRINEDSNGEALCTVSGDAVSIHRKHPLVDRAAREMDDATIAFVTSVVCTTINRFYVEITDSHESELQRLFLQSRRAGAE